MPEKYYAVKEGRQQGVTDSHRMAEAQTKGYSGNDCKAFNNVGEAKQYVQGNHPQNKSGK